MKKESILCPGTEHAVYKKTLIFKSKNSLFAYCKTHGWVEIQFVREGIPISFENTAIKILPVPYDFIDAEPAPTVSIGGFSKKCRQ